MVLVLALLQLFITYILSWFLLIPFFFSCFFFVVGNATYKSLCLSVGRSVGCSVCQSVDPTFTFSMRTA